MEQQIYLALIVIIALAMFIIGTTNILFFILLQRDRKEIKELYKKIIDEQAKALRDNDNLKDNKEMNF